MDCKHPYITIKIVIAESGSLIIGCTVGPFESEKAAETYAAHAMVGSLGYEKWLVRELQVPASLN